MAKKVTHTDSPEPGQGAADTAGARAFEALAHMATAADLLTAAAGEAFGFLAARLRERVGQLEEVVWHD